jgi:hypothetical protein
MRTFTAHVTRHSFNNPVRYHISVRPSATINGVFTETSELTKALVLH